MKKAFSILLAICFYAALQGQTFTCPDGNGPDSRLVFSNFICFNGGDNTIGNEVIRFTVTGDNGNSSECLTGWPELPTVVSADPADNVEVTNVAPPEICFWYGTSAFEVVLQVPSINCTPLNLTLAWGISGCPDENLEIVPVLRNIPTLGQWGIIALALICSIFGIVKIRHAFQRQVL